MSDCQRAVDEVKGKEANRKEFHNNATNLYYFKCHCVPQAFVVFLKSELDLVLKKCESGNPAFYLPIADRDPRGVGCVGFVCKSPPATAELSLISYT